jgi:HEPN domain-containing protein
MRSHAADDDYRIIERLEKEACDFPTAIAFHAQQAAEKYLKALLTLHAVEFPKISPS